MVFPASGVPGLSGRTSPEASMIALTASSSSNTCRSSTSMLRIASHRLNRYWRSGRSDRRRRRCAALSATRRLVRPASSSLPRRASRCTSARPSRAVGRRDTPRDDALDDSSALPSTAPSRGRSGSARRPLLLARLGDTRLACFADTLYAAPQHGAPSRSHRSSVTVRPGPRPCSVVGRPLVEPAPNPGAQPSRASYSKPTFHTITPVPKTQNESTAGSKLRGPKHHAHRVVHQGAFRSVRTRVSSETRGDTARPSAGRHGRGGHRSTPRHHLGARGAVRSASEGRRGVLVFSSIRV